MWFYINEWNYLKKCINQFSDESAYFLLFRAPQAALNQCATGKSYFLHQCIVFYLSDKMLHTVIMLCYYYYYY